MQDTALPASIGITTWRQWIFFQLQDLAPDSLFMAAPDCSSWGVPSRGTSMRNFINAAGNVFLDWVKSSNCMMSRFSSYFFVGDPLNVNLSYGQHHVQYDCFRGRDIVGKTLLRTVLVCLLALANNCIFVVEQPAQSLAGRWFRFEWLINHVAWDLIFGWILSTSFWLPQLP